MKYFLKVSTVLFVILGLVGCGDSASSTTGSSLSVETQKSEINELQDELKIDFSITSDYANNVEVQLSDFSISVTPCIIEQVIFSPSEVTLNETRDKQDVHVVLEFTEACTPTSYALKATSLLSLDGKTNEVGFNSGVIETIPTIVKGETVVVDSNNTPIVVGDVTLPIVVIPSTLKNIVLTTNSKTIEIPIKVFKDIAPYATGSVKVELPSKVLTGIDVGVFEAYEVAVNEQGVALFNYTGPSNLKALMDNNDTSSIFKFYHTENSSNKQEVKVEYDIAEDSYVPVDYVLNIITQGNDFSMGIPNLQKTFSVVLKDSEDKLIDSNDINITKIEVETQNALVAKIMDTKTQLAVNKLELNKENNSAFILISKNLSGLVPIKVNMEFIDINKKAQTLSTIVNVRVMSGPPSAISISYVSTGQDAERAKYEEKFAVSVTDEYGNRVNTQPYISLGAIVGYAVDGREASSRESHLTKRLYYGKTDIETGVANGIVNPLDDEVANTTHFEDDICSDVFQWVNAEGANTDKLVVFGRGKNYEAMGKWDFSKLDNNTLTLEDDYFGKYRGELSYAIGHNYYQDQCLDDSREWLGSTDSETYQLDNEGTVIVSYKYDYQLMGKDALVWVNLNGYQADTQKNTRIGEVVKHTLRGQKLVKVPTSGYSLDKNETASVDFEIWHSAVNKRYRNAHFSWRVKEGSSCEVVYYYSSNNYDARTCNNGRSSLGSSYIVFQLQAPEDKGCTFDIDQLYLASEF